MPVEDNSKIIFPYIDGQLIDLANFPKISKYFNSYKSKLLKRNFEHTAEEWYKYGRIQSLKKFDGSIKMIWTVLGLKPRYTIDFNNIFVTGGGNGPYYCLRPKDEYEDDYLYYLLAILSPPLIDMMVIRGSSSFKGDFYSRGKTFIKDIPIKTISTTIEKKYYTNIIEETKELLSLGVQIEREAIPEKEKFYTDKFSKIKNNIFKKINKLYDLIE